MMVEAQTPPELAHTNAQTVTVKYVWANRATYSRKRGLDSSNTHSGPVV